MKCPNIFFYSAIVSKSLLIVLGTSLFVMLLPAKNCRGKCRPAGIERSRRTWTTRRTRVAHTYHRTTTTTDALPAIPTDCNYAQTAQGVRAMHRTPCFPVSMGVFWLVDFPSRILLVFRSSANCTAQAVCPCQGSRLNDLLLRLCVTCPNKICLASRRSLDNSYPPRSSRRLCGKQKNNVFFYKAQSVLGSAPRVRASEYGFAPRIGW